MPDTKPAKTSGVQNPEYRKRRREWLLVLLIIGLVALSLRYQGQLFDLTSEIPLTGNILVLALINLNILLISSSWNAGEACRERDCVASWCWPLSPCR